MNALTESQGGKPRLRLPLYAKILGWFVVNLTVVGGLVFLYFRISFGGGYDWVLSGPAEGRIELLSSYMQSVLVERPQREWPEIVENFGRYLEQPLPAWEKVMKKQRVSHTVTFALFLPNGEQAMGRQVEAPPEVQRRLIDKRLPESRPRPGRPDDAADMKMRPPKPRFIIRSEHPTRYWAGIHSDISWEQDGQWYPLTFVIVASDMSAGGLLFDWWPWMIILGMGIGISALLWLPVVGGITRAIRRTNDASKRIAAGQFDVRLADTRGDELGELAHSVNTMAEQLGEYVAQQRRITADVAHELCSPIARMQMALGVVEQRGTPEQATYLRKIDNELQHMAKLVEEVLAFSKAATLCDREAAETFDLRELINQVIEREAPEASLQLSVDEITIHTFRSALDRALGNVLRNAVRYARDIEIHARRQGDEVSIQILDRGPGVPEEVLPRLFEAFYRPEAARGRNTGGSGLGLAITQRCIESCGGTVTARNREGGGLVVECVIPLGGKADQA